MASLGIFYIYKDETNLYLKIIKILILIIAILIFLLRSFNEIKNFIKMLRKKK